MFGTAAAQRGRALQFAFMMSRNSSAVVAGSTGASFSSGGGGVTALVPSEMTAALDCEPSRAMQTAPAATAAKRDVVILSSLCVGRPLSAQAPVGAASPKNRTVAPLKAHGTALIIQDRQSRVG